MNKFYSLVAALSMMVAAFVASSACVWFSYQPEEPKSLRD